MIGFSVAILSIDHMGVSKNVLGAGEWCAPTKELPSGQLLGLVHKTRKLIRETLQPVRVVEAEADDEVVMLVDVKLPAHEAPRVSVTGAPVYPVMRDRFRGLRLALGVVAIAGTAGMIALFAL